MNSRTLLLVCVAAAAFLGTVHSQCSLPTESQIASLISKIISSLGGEGSAPAVDVISYHFTCIAVGATENTIRLTSVAVVYDRIESGGSVIRLREQFQFQCSGSILGVADSTPVEQNPPPEAFNATTRRDCFTCAVSGSSLIDPVTNCAVCESCQSLGQGACTGPTTCCPLYEGGVCVSDCSANRIANASSNFSCECPSGFTMVAGNCVMHICDTDNPCQNEGSCNVDGDNYNCSCISPWTGQNCSVCSLQCENGGTPNATICSECDCPDEFNGTLCESDVDECIENNGDGPCENDASCVNGFGNFTCICSNGFNGTLCEEDINECLDEDTCLNGGTCTNTNGSFTCQCPTGYYGTTCSHIDQCDLNDPCMNNGNCTNTTSTGGFLCQCPTGYYGKSCSNINQCDLDDQCVNNGICINTTSTGGFQCQCPAGYCANNGVCMNTTSTGGFVCLCQRGFVGSRCELVTNCSTMPGICENGGVCRNMVTGYVCACMQGYSGVHCENRDFCTSNPCQNRGACVERPNGYSCTCITGYTGQNCESCFTGEQLQDGSRCVQQEEAANTAPIIGGVVGGIILLVIIVVAAVVITVLAMQVIHLKQAVQRKGP